jgi:hypothetical protein
LYLFLLQAVGRALRSGPALTSTTICVDLPPREYYFSAPKAEVEASEQAIWSGGLFAGPLSQVGPAGGADVAFG